MGIKEKEGKEKEETGAALPPQLVWKYFHYFEMQMIFSL